MSFPHIFLYLGTKKDIPEESGRKILLPNHKENRISLVAPSERKSREQ